MQYIVLKQFFINQVVGRGAITSPPQPARLIICSIAQWHFEQMTNATCD
ncbi:MAG: hypothetical protein ACN6QE_18080 [Pseudomonas putida]